MNMYTKITQEHITHLGNENTLGKTCGELCGFENNWA